jgi:hypothetical protein
MNLNITNHMTRKHQISNRRITRYAFVFLAFFITYPGQQAYAQYYHLPCPEILPQDFSNQAMIFALNYTPKQPYASKQFYNTWTKGAVIFADGKKAHQVMLSYNVWLDELLWINENSYQIGVIPKESIREFVLWNEKDEEKEIFRNVKTPGMKWANSFFQVLAEGNYIVYCQYKYAYEPGKRDFEKSEVYYLQTGGSLQKFIPTRRGILSLFPKDQRHEIRQLIRKNYSGKFNKADLASFFGSLNANDTTAIQ